MTVLGALEREPRSLAELMLVTGLPRATTYRLATALEAHGLVRRDLDGRFALGLGLVALGRAAAHGLGLPEVARPALEALRDATGESAQLYVRDGDRRVCVEALESPHGLRTIVPLGAALPLDVGSAGRILRGDPESLKRGWAESVAEREAGVASVSAPVRGARRLGDRGGQRERPDRADDPPARQEVRRRRRRGRSAHRARPHGRRVTKTYSRLFS